MKYFIIYMTIGYVVSFYFINLFRLSGMTKPKKNDALLGMIGPFIWPLQIIHYFIFNKTINFLKKNNPKNA